MLTGPIPATQTILRRTGLRIADFDRFEVNEAFASVPLAWRAHFDTDLERINPRGGSIALGHPLGASGARLLASLVCGLEDSGGRDGLQTMCEAGGWPTRPSSSGSDRSLLQAVLGEHLRGERVHQHGRRPAGDERRHRVAM